MASSIKENTIRKALAVQEVYLVYQGRHLSNVKIYELHIKEQFFISERTFYRYLSMNARKLVRQFEEECD